MMRWEGMASCAIPVGQTTGVAGNFMSPVWEHQPMHEWSASEKKIARRAYEAARQAVLAAELAEFKVKAAAAGIDEMWSIGDELRQRRREIEELLDYRYSQLTLVFG